ncbi:MAG: hypothetical protein Q4E02_00015 [Lagierella massiliensis]|nr:hypothetical protein [Lagierella massiliensis]
MIKNKVIKVLKLCLFILIMGILYSCGVNISSNENMEDFVELEDGSLYDFNIHDGIFFEYEELTIHKEIEYIAEKDTNIIIKASGSSGDLVFSVEGDNTSEVFQWNEEDLYNTVFVNEEDRILITIDAIKHSGEFEIIEDTK